MSRNRDERGQYTETVSLSEVLEVFDTVAGPVVTSGDIASATGCSRDTARRKLETLQEQGRIGRRKTAGHVVYWGLDAADPNPVDLADPIFMNRPSFSSAEEDLSEKIDEILYGNVHILL
jgi:biotin operon repressor